MSLLQRVGRMSTFWKKLLNVHIHIFDFYLPFFVCLPLTFFVPVLRWSRAAVVLDYLSRRESPRRCGGRRGGLNDSQHCAVGPGLQSPQRWSFPPPPSHSPSPSPSTQRAAALLSPSNHFATPTFFSGSWTQPKADWRRPPSHLQPKFEPRLFLA